MPELQRGAQLAGRYTLVRKLGAGLSAETWKADDRLTGTSVALKIQNDETQSVEVLRREWRFSIRLMHPHIVRAFEFHDDPNAAFFSMQLIEGPDISVLSGAPIAEIFPPVALIADALRYAHGKDLVHRDLKASNILLDGNGAPYLIDFGVASTRSGNVGGGSLIAASPQQLAGQPAHPSDDIFALGGLIYELVSGRSPYSAADTENSIIHDVPPPMATADGTHAPTPLRHLVAKMLEKDPHNRPDAETVIAELEAAGIRAGAAPQTVVGSGKPLPNEVIESESTERVRQTIAASDSNVRESKSRGLNSRVVGFSLAALIVLLLGVIFLLPKTITEGPSDAVVDSETPPSDVPPEVDSEQTPQSGVLPQRDERVQARNDTDKILGELLSTVRTLEGRAVERWGGLPYKRAKEIYSAGDDAYLKRDYALASDKYQQAIDLLDPLLGQVDTVFQSTLTEAQLALDNAETADAVRLYELAVAITPSHGPALAGLARAKNLDTVLSLTEQGLQYERDLELIAAKQSFERAIEIDPQWQAAHVALERVLGTMNQMEFDLRMTEGLTALADGEYRAARAAFRMAQELQPNSPDPADGLLQVDQGIRLGNIAALERDAKSLETGERWDDAAESYEKLLELDGTLSFAQSGLARANEMSALHQTLDGYIEDPDSLSSPRTMQRATTLVVDITRMENIGPRLADQRDQLSRLLKRAATPLTVTIVSDNATDVSIYKVAKLGTFDATELTLRPGTYVAVGSRPGFRDVRLEFRVAPEIEMQPVIIRCEERI